MEILYFIGDYYVQIVLGILVGYLLGSINFAIIFSKMFGHIDICMVGSKNAGFTNVLRSVGVFPAVLTFVCDFSKNLAALFISSTIYNLITFSGMKTEVSYTCCIYTCAIACMIGHIYPCFFSFKGGKAVVSLISSMMFIDARVFLIEIIIFGIVVAASKIVSLASIVTAITFPIATFSLKFFLDYLNPSVSVYPSGLANVLIATFFSLIMAVIVIVRHKSNIERLVSKEEKKIRIFSQDG